MYVNITHKFCFGGQRQWHAAFICAVGLSGAIVYRVTDKEDPKSTSAFHMYIHDTLLPKQRSSDAQVYGKWWNCRKDRKGQEERSGRALGNTAKLRRPWRRCKHQPASGRTKGARLCKLEPEAIVALQKSTPAAVFSCGCTASAADAVWLPSWFCDPREAPEKHGCISAVGSEEKRAGEGVRGHRAPAQS